MFGGVFVMLLMVIVLKMFVEWFEIEIEYGCNIFGVLLF